MILGATGMLGSSFLNFSKVEVDSMLFSSRQHQLPQGKWFHFETRDSFEKLGELDLNQEDLVVNCIGIIKSKIDSNNHRSVREALEVNSIFPLRLADYAETRGFRVLQIATDCVFSGSTGFYTENSEHDALDVYGRTKSLGEVLSPNFMNLRVSIIGPEIGSGSSLVEWVRNQPKNGVITGFQDHLWNGVTSFNFAQLALGIFKARLFRSGTYHLVPKDYVTKDELVRLIAARLERNDLRVESGNSGHAVNRTLATSDNNFNNLMWTAAGFDSPPTIGDMVMAMPTRGPLVSTRNAEEN